MSSSIVVAGAIFLLNSVLLCNYYFIKKLRQVTDEEDDMFQKMDDLQKNSGIAQRVQACWGKRKRNISKSVVNSERIQSFKEKVTTVILGQAIMESNSIEQFSGWKPVPLRAGTISTAFLLLISVFLVLSDDYINIDVGKSQTSKFCSEKDVTNKNTAFNTTVYSKDVTNFYVGKRQFDATSSFGQALVNDTTLFGEAGYTCPGENGTKVEYTKKGLNIERGPFFPGYCEEALTKAIKSSKDTSCVDTEKLCISNSLGGLTSLFDSEGNVTSASNLLCSKVETPTVCLPHSLDADVDNSTLRNYRIEQLKKSSDDNNDGSAYINDLISGSEDAEASNSVNRLLKQANTAGDMFTVYSVIAMFFPSPLKIFSAPIGMRLQQTIFGMNKDIVMFSVLSIWSLYEYVNSLIRTPNVGKYFQSLANDPCFLDSKFVEERYLIIGEVCEQLVKMENDWAKEKSRIDSILPEVLSFYDNCSCPFPYKNLETVTSRNLNDQDAEEIAFGKEWTINTEESIESPFVPKYNSTFLADTEICYSKVSAMKHVFSLTASFLDDEQEQDNDPGFWKIWISSGLLATFLIKISITNYTMSLYKHADPFAPCNGRYEGPPESLAESFNISGKLTEEKKKELKAASLRGLITWCLITNLCMFSLFWNLRTEFGSYEKMEYVIFGVLIGLALLVPIPCYFLARKVSSRRSAVGENNDTGIEGAAEP